MATWGPHHHHFSPPHTQVYTKLAEIQLEWWLELFDYNAIHRLPFSAYQCVIWPLRALHSWSLSGIESFCDLMNCCDILSYPSCASSFSDSISQCGRSAMSKKSKTSRGSKEKPFARQNLTAPLNLRFLRRILNLVGTFLLLLLLLLRLLTSRLRTGILVE